MKSSKKNDTDFYRGGVPIQRPLILDDLHGISKAKFYATAKETGAVPKKSFSKLFLFGTKSLTLFFVLFAYLAMGQSKNDSILQYAQSHIGKKVGRGLCIELVEAAVYSVNKNWKQEYPTYKTSLNSGNYKGFGRQVKSKDTVIPGDIILFLGKYNSSHVGIISQVLSDKEYEIIDQNSMDRIDKKSCVGTWVYKKGDLGVEKTIIFRPY